VAASLFVAAPATAFVGAGHSGWTWANPTPQGQDLNALDFAGSTGYAAGVLGTLLRTDDGGSTWSSIASPYRQQFLELDVISPTSFVAGGLCRLVRSDDGGATLRRLHFVRGDRCAGNYIGAVEFPTTDVGFVFGGGRRVLKTTDGGKTFAPAGEPGVGVVSAFFKDTGEGYAVGSVSWDRFAVVRTTDGGATWVEVAHTRRGLIDLTFASDQVGYAVGQDGLVLRTVDGGATWSRRRDFVAGRLNDVACGDELNCVAREENGERVFRTGDGFATATTPTPGSFDPHAVAFSAPGRAVVVGEGGRTSTSADGGATWEQVGETLVETLGEPLRQGPGGVAFAGPATSSDGGETWLARKLPTTVDPVTSTWFSSEQIGYAVAGDRLYATTDGGESWAARGPSFAAPSDVWASRNGVRVVVSDARGAHRSTDGGRHVQRRLIAPAGSSPWALDQSPGGALLAWRSDGLADSRDGGDSWAQIPRPPGSSLVHAQLVNRTVAHVLTRSRRLLRTTTRGRRWREIRSLGVVPTPSVLSFADPRHGWVAASRFPREFGGWLLRTSDGGRSWRPQAVDANGIRSVLAISPTDGIVQTAGLLFTRSEGDLPEPTTLTLEAGRRTVPRGDRVRLAGRLRPERAGIAVLVSMRRPGAPRWSTRRVRTNAEGRFSVRFRVTGDAWFVAQWTGGRNAASAGTPAVRVRATGG
jgi:photosystem II stability/assembly factor-like uncharacterized protein